MLSMLHPLSPLSVEDAMLAMLQPRLALDDDASCRLSTSAPIVAEAPDRKNYSVSISAPGVAPHDLEVEVMDGRLSVRGSTSTAAHTHFVNYTVALPADADPEEAAAEGADGIITITVPKKVKTEATRIEVSADEEPPLDDETDGEPTEMRPYKLTVVAAGIAAADLDIRAERGVLTVRGESKRTGARVARRFNLPRDADARATTAVHRDGVLTLTVPKTAAAEPRRLVVGAPLVGEEEEEMGVVV